ncbi:hypothetical protein ACFHYQ_11225 [Sphaerimonospora cavernae]|uniref:DUF5666 domain-containing protein n=1 Tax=Sphaerimonospora cavernae TaxID=1740611 RepID=A0ABV6U323_9ACTN
MTDSEIRPPEFPPRGPARRSPGRRLILGVATAAVIATGAGVAAAGNSASVHLAAQPPGVQPSPGASATAPNGGYQTFTTQTGVVTSAGENSISVKGDDGSARTYAVNGSTRVCAGPEGMSGIRSGDKVWVIGSAQGQRPTAFMIMDLTRPQWPGHGAGGPGGPGGPGGSAPPAPTGPGAPAPSESVPAPYSPGGTPGETAGPETAGPETVEPTD